VTSYHSHKPQTWHLSSHFCLMGFVLSIIRFLFHCLVGAMALLLDIKQPFLHAVLWLFLQPLTKGKHDLKGVRHMSEFDWMPITYMAK